ncbi:MAG: Mov34/MPN/PAD-1 family protein [Methanobrevibacter sp.]|uniref:Peptidase n=1 Tax=Methanobrevibacter millerae TaxID=230361 RepID=A0A8T3VDF7_9EURY|nr:Mov34/MPN/PAD-1 family protein [Methanobrevibacter millerae]MBE6506149.1 peptidase [Methanobrevibacter millerae]MBR0371350.1 Mov34/MPN/PAD-1 family protein [Methanobrevibacter sp.]
MSFLSKIFNSDDVEEFDEICVDREVLDAVIYYAKQSYPNEFLAFFDGEIKDRKLYILALIFVPGETGSTGAVVHTEMLPPTMKYWGSVHSHPGPSAQPSGADLKTFSKHGIFHMIVCLPYSYATFKAYDKYGSPCKYIVGDYSEMFDEDIDDFFDESDVLKEGEVIKPGFFDEDANFDDEPNTAYEEYEKRHMQNNNIKIISNNSLEPIIIPKDGSLKIEFDENGNIKKISKK